MKLLNLNIGIKLDNNDEVIDLISKDAYDIVTMQESIRKIDGAVTDMYNSSNIIKSKINFKNSFFGPMWVADHHEKNNIVTKDFGGFIEQGNEVIANYPILKARNVFYYKDYSIFADTTNFKQEDHPRAFVDMIIDINNEKLQIINVHGIWNKDKVGDERTIEQSKAILSRIRKDIPCIVVGDFNLLPNTESIEMLNRDMINLINTYNIKSTRPNKENIVNDYIFVNEKVTINDFKVIKSNISDHFPLVIDFDI